MKLKFADVPDSMFIKSQLERGMNVERDEHTNSNRTAKTIAKSHIIETGWKTASGKWTSLYYPNLSIMERKLKRQAKTKRRSP